MLICCAICSQLRKSSVFTHSNSNNSAATSRATRKYGAVPERPGKNEEQNSINFSKWCAVGPDSHFSMKPWIPCNILFNLMNIFVLSFYGKNIWSLGCISTYCVGAGISTLMSIFEGLGSYTFRRKMEKTQYRVEEKDGKVFFPAWVGIFCLYS